ncbi:MAG: DUF169 domain-containing protein [Thermoguttaceae bacterium]|jgi:uncharacterized protein (DUF169 family)|nr:DUF169 domain-containing protein [Thermoguttaceae bacterium]
MNKKLKETLHLELEPVGIYFGNEAAQCDLDASPEKRNCVVPLLAAAAKGKTISMNEESCNCAGGAVGCCFGDGFARRNPEIQKMLSQGFGENVPDYIPTRMKDGEKFFLDEETALKWRNNLPLSEKAYPRIVFAPMQKWDEIGTPDLVFVFADPDQISALVALLGFHNGRALNTIAPFGAACHSILYAAEQMESDDPKAVMGLFDISQRSAAMAKYLSMTMPYALWEKITQDLDKSCLTTHSWQAIEKRMKEAD